MRLANKMKMLTAMTAAALLALSGCGSSGGASGGSSNSVASSGDGSVIGALLPLTGTLAYLAPPEVAAIKLAISDINKAGGVLGKIISTAGFVDYMSENAAFLSSVGIFFPFLIAAILKSAQGSSTVAITTTAGIMGAISESGSMMAALGLTSPVAAALTVMAIGAGAMTVSHANDSYFWVVTNFGELKAQDGYKTQTMLTLLMGVAAMIFIWILSLILI